MPERHTDLALEAREMAEQDTGSIPGADCEERLCGGFPLTTVHITTQEASAALGKPRGLYHTLDLTSMEQREPGVFSRAVTALSHLLTPLLGVPAEEVLVVGLGNRAITPDALGPKCADRVLVTRHLVEMVPEHFGSFRPVSALSPGVLGTTGMESGEIVAALVRRRSFQRLVVIDALAARRLERLCSTVQISDSGIAPGSGVGNHRFALNEETMGIPVIAIGVPTVVDGATLAADLLEASGADSDPELFRNTPGASLLVSPRDIDQRVEETARVIAYGLTMALQPHLTPEELEGLLD